MHRLEGAPRGTVAVTKKAGQQVCRVSRAGWERCSCPAITPEMGVGGTKRGARTALPAGSAREMGAETAAVRTVKKKKCTGFPFPYSFSFSPFRRLQKRNSTQVLTSTGDVFAKNNPSSQGKRYTEAQIVTNALSEPNTK